MPCGGAGAGALSAQHSQQGVLLLQARVRRTARERAAKSQQEQGTWPVRYQSSKGNDGAPDVLAAACILMQSRNTGGPEGQPDNSPGAASAHVCATFQRLLQDM